MLLIQLGIEVLNLIIQVTIAVSLINIAEYLSRRH
jgi:hypothetical protein